MTYDDGEAYDPTADPDPVQVARRLHEYGQAIDGRPSWDELTDDQRAAAVEAIRRLLAWLVRSGWDRWAPAT